MKAIFLILSVLVLGGSVACGDSVGVPAPDPAASTSADLTLGSRGDAVRALTQSLTAYGYFPNPDLATNYPAWRPVVPVAPADASVYDDRTAQAVIEFQGRNGLPSTGIVDQATRDLLRQARCGYPDSARLDPADKFARQIDLPAPPGGNQCNKWNVSSVFYYVKTAAPGVSTSDMQAAADLAAQSWNIAAGQRVAKNIPLPGTINFISGTNAHANIVILGSGADSGDSADTFPECDSSGNYGPLIPIAFDGTGVETFSVASPTPSGSLDVQTILLHELGHALGLQHSADPSAAMYAFFKLGVQHRVLDADDEFSLSSLYARAYTNSSWPLAYDIGAEGSGLVKPWMVDVKGNVYQYSQPGVGNGSWVRDTKAPAGCSAVSVDFASTPYVLDGQGHAWRKIPAGWSAMGSNVLYDIGVSGDGSFLWAIGAPLAANNQDGSVYEWNGSTWVRDSLGGTGETIAVNQSGIPFVTRSDGSILYKDSALASQGTAWDSLPYLPGNVYPLDIGISNNNGAGLEDYAWVAGNDGNVYMYQGQAATTGKPKSNLYTQWDKAPFTVPSGAFALDVDGQGFGWVVANSGQIYQVQP